MIGSEGFARLVADFYSQVRHDDLVGSMYPPQDLDGAEQRLLDFLIYRFGGPQSYIEQRGHPRLRARHSAFPIDQAARDRWSQLMSNALAAFHPRLSKSCGNSLRQRPPRTEAAD
jgi:hemoglobin